MLKSGLVPARRRAVCTMCNQVIKIVILQDFRCWLLPTSVTIWRCNRCQESYDHRFWCPALIQVCYVNFSGPLKQMYLWTVLGKRDGVRLILLFVFESFPVSFEYSDILTARVAIQFLNFTVDRFLRMLQPISCFFAYNSILQEGMFFQCSWVFRMSLISISTSPITPHPRD